GSRVPFGAAPAARRSGRSISIAASSSADSCTHRPGDAAPLGQTPKGNRGADARIGSPRDETMLDLDFQPTGRHFLQIPGPRPVTHRNPRAMSLPTIDHRGPEFGALGRKVLADIRKVFKTRHPVVLFTAARTHALQDTAGH